jgi:U3 small nucleolar RNA-associated protein 23
MKPSEKMVQLIQNSSAHKYMPTPEEMVVVKAANKEEREQENKEKILKIRRAAELQGIQLKKRAKAPNPLSVQKKQKKE